MKIKKWFFLILACLIGSLLLIQACAASSDYPFTYDAKTQTLLLKEPSAEGTCMTVAAYKNGQFVTAVTEKDGMIPLAGIDADCFKAIVCGTDGRPVRKQLVFRTDDLTEMSLQGGTSMLLQKLYAKQPLFSFTYGGKSSSELLASWDCTQKTTESGSIVTVETVWTDPDSGLRITCTASEDETGVTEWVCRLKNTGSVNTPLIEDFRIADLELSVGGDYRDGMSVGFSRGSQVSDRDFLFSEQSLARLCSLRFAAADGRSTSGGCMPYFNLHGEGGGCIFAIGWTGQWEASFHRSLNDNVTIRGGMEKTRFVLYPGESVRTPSAALLLWSGAEEDSYNIWRGFMIKNHTPKDEAGAIVTLPITCGAWGGDKAQGHLNMITALKNAGADYDAYWIDSGWFGSNDRHSTDQYGDEWFKNVGDWYVNTSLYPNGLKPIGDKAHESGYDFLLWFEPERAWNDSWIVREHESWFLKGPNGSTSYLLDMGNDEARCWITDYISDFIQKFGVDVYRQDFNIESLPYWKANDAPDRQGVTEMKYIEGLYAYLAGLRKKNPGLILDNCAGGGRRLDYEMLGYALPLWRSDYQCFDTYETTPCQIQTDGLCRWVPLNGTGVQSRPDDTYSFRSNLAYAVQFPFASNSVQWHAKMLADFHAAQPYFAGDYYKLTDGDITSSSTWYVYEQLREDLNGGFVMAFRREKCYSNTAMVSLRVPQDVTKVVCTDADTGEKTELTKTAPGRFAMSIMASQKKEAKLIYFELIRS